MLKYHYSFTHINQLMKNIVNEMKSERFSPELIISINRGGCIPGIMLSHYLDIPHKPIGKYDQISEEDLSKNILVIDEINDTGKQLNMLFEKQPKTKNIRVAVLYNNTKSSFNGIDYSGVSLDKNNIWIVFPWENWWE